MICVVRIQVSSCYMGVPFRPVVSDECNTLHVADTIIIHILTTPALFFRLCIRGGV